MNIKILRAAAYMAFTQCTKAGEEEKKALVARAAARCRCRINDKPADWLPGVPSYVVYVCW